MIHRLVVVRVIPSVEYFCARKKRTMQMNRCKITFIGGGSSKFIREVVVDLFTYPALEDSHIELMDVDTEGVGRPATLSRFMAMCSITG